MSIRWIGLSWLNSNCVKKACLDGFVGFLVFFERLYCRNNLHVRVLDLSEVRLHVILDLFHINSLLFGCSNFEVVCVTNSLEDQLLAFGQEVLVCDIVESEVDAG